MAYAYAKNIAVYAHWKDMAMPMLMGQLSVAFSKGKEHFSFAYQPEWLATPYALFIDPDLQQFGGNQYPQAGKENFGLFLDSCPDRWGRTLMQRRASLLAIQEGQPVKHLRTSDFLLGVFDSNRMGALRFKTEASANFLDDSVNYATPPWTSLRQLDYAASQLEKDNSDDPAYLPWLDMLIAPGSSLGGARPKAGVTDTAGHLWIAKFPSRQDRTNVAAWEMTVHDMAVNAGIIMAEAKLLKLNGPYDSFITKRFDRDDEQNRIHFASAMTLLGYTDGEASADASYLEMADFIVQHGANVSDDLEQLWRRIVFNILTKNTDDHLRNHGFLLQGDGWHLSPAYDLNPNVYGTGLSLNISEVSNALSIGVAKEVAPFFRLSAAKAKEIIEELQTTINTWRTTASSYGLSKFEQDAMAPAFQAI